MDEDQSELDSQTSARRRRSPRFSILYLPFSILVFLCALCVSAVNLSADPKPVPPLQIIPQPNHEAAFVRDDTEIARYHFGPDLRRPFVFPVIGPSGRSLTRMGHPHDPVTHSHHNSAWVSHHDVNGVSFWDDHGKGRIVTKQIDRYDDLGDTSAIIASNVWIDEGHNNKPLLNEIRRTAIELRPNNQYLLYLDMDLRPAGDAAVTFGKTPFGLVGVRMAKTIGVNDGGGEIRNSAGKSGEKEILWQSAKWCDYSGPIRDGVIEGITLMDHPANPNHPTRFHVRADGWMGASLTQDGPRRIEPGSHLRLRYALYVHAGKPSAEDLDKVWSEFAKAQLPDLSLPKKK